MLGKEKRKDKILVREKFFLEKNDFNFKYMGELA